ncbi:NUDIX hydrolase [Paracraurococcus lichenis]|uniref:NUDIX hydrolase n=1 Tax=Paracraurococcus lichenis TaxID=3064888 RepID=A0ABT9E2W3_9PROT|nr:NUDIX hydrolase [Paracraurococcus sp. LOR1-02]MDO9710435.1 NUDIX hydrolase [Paracraurococcus sp. LOR1-02]
MVFRLGYPLARLSWALRRPARNGVMVAVWWQGRILVLRQSYRRGLTFPGGAIEPGEAPEAAARRELREEVGLEAPPGALRPAGEVTVRFESCRDHVRFFELRPEAPPQPRPDNREIIWAGFLDSSAALAERMPPYVRLYLKERIVARR